MNSSALTGTLVEAGGVANVAGPISNDDIYNFNSNSDKIDLVSFAGISSFGNIHITGQAS